MQGVLVAVIAIMVGALAGRGIRALLATIRRGMVLPAGPPELATAAITVIGAGSAWGTPRLFLVGLAGLLLVALGWIDVVHHRLPDAITLPAIPVAVAVVAVTALAVPGSGSLLRAGLCGLALWVAFGAVARISPRSMGLGDVKLVPTLGILTGYESVASAVVAVGLAFVLGALVAVAGLALRRVTPSSAIPFGPFLLAGCWLALALPGIEDLLLG